MPLCIAQAHQSAALHSRGLDKCRKSTAIMGLRYANSDDHGPELCKAKIIQGEGRADVEMSFVVAGLRREHVRISSVRWPLP